MEINLSLGELFYKAFGYKSDAFNPAFQKATGDKQLSRTELGKYGSPYYATDLFGREYYLPIEVQVGLNNVPGTSTSYAEKFGVTDSYGAYTGRWYLPYPVMSIDINEHIIDTELTERDGLVSELINSSGYKITIKGFLINQNNEFPEADFYILNKLPTLQCPIRINNVKTDILFNVTANPDKLATIRKLSFPAKTGVKHVQPYELELITEVPFNLIDIS